MPLLRMRLMSGLAPPFHLEHPSPRGRIHILPDMSKTAALVKTDRAGVIVVDQERNASRRQAFGLIYQTFGQFGALVIGGDHQLVEIDSLVDGDESDVRALLLSETSAY